MAKRKRRLNSADSAAAMYESFHGAPSTGELVIEDRVHYHGNLAELGVLCGLKVRVVTGYDVTLQFGGGPGQQEGNPSISDAVLQHLKPGQLAFSTSSHRQISRIKRYGVTGLDWVGPASLGSKTKIYRADDTESNRHIIVQAGGKIYKKKPNPPGPLTKAYRFGTGIVPGLLEGADSALGTVVNPRDKADEAYRVAVARMRHGNPSWGTLKDRWGAVVTSDNGAVQVVFTGAEGEVQKVVDDLKVKGFKARSQRLRADSGVRRGWQRASNPGSDTGPVILCSNESGNQLYFRGGDQALDLASIKMADFERDHMVIGEVWGLAYATKKEFDKFQEIEYVHILGLEKFHQRMAESADLWEDALPPKDEAFGCGNLPTLNYDTLNAALSLAGGVYKIDKPMFSTSPGIEN